MNLYLASRTSDRRRIPHGSRPALPAEISADQTVAVWTDIHGSPPEQNAVGRRQNAARRLLPTAFCLLFPIEHAGDRVIRSLGLCKRFDADFSGRQDQVEVTRKQHKAL